MNKLFVVVLLAGFGACFGGLLDLIPGFCNVDADCGSNKCCLLGKLCSFKLQANFPCRLQSLLKCGCTEGLECKVTMNFTILGGLVYEYRQCRAAGNFLAPQQINTEPRREKRFLLRDCNNDSECGVKSCCSSLGNKCIPLLPEHAPCKTAGCCRAGLECRVTYTLYNPLTGEKIYDVRQCKRASQRSEAQAIEVSEA